MTYTAPPPPVQPSSATPPPSQGSVAPASTITRGLRSAEHEFPELCVNVLLEEYRTLREESLSGIQARHQIVTFAFGAISVFLAGILSSDASPLMLGLLSYLAVPQIAKSSLLMWLGEYRRSARAGGRLRELEQAINAHCKAPLLGWENRLSTSRVHMTYPYTATVFVIQLVAIVSIIIGVFYITAFALAHPVLDFTGILPGKVVPLSASAIVFFLGGALLLVSVAVETWFWRYFTKNWREVRESNNNAPTASAGAI